MMKLIGIMFIVLFLISTHVGGASALTEQPSFPSCTAPTGTLKVKYDSGTHGIVGNTGVYQGRDSVYQLDTGNVFQCFCPESGDIGIQTNFWKFPPMTEGDIQSFKSDGWVFIPDGSLWGLMSDPYLAKNYDYQCRGASSGGNGGIGGGGQVLGGFAETGDIVTLLGAGAIGVSLMVFGTLIRWRR